MRRPYVLLSVATSIDGYIDDTSPDRLLLSNSADFDRVDQTRAESDAILIGAGTIRADNPRLLVNSENRRHERVSRGLPEYPLKVTITGRGDLDPNQNFWHYGGEKLIYTTNAAAAKLGSDFTELAEIVPIGDSIDGFGQIVDDLGRRGVNRLMVEGGSSIHTAFLSQGLVDEIHLAIAPLVVGQAAAPRFLDPAVYPGGPTRRMRLLGTEAIDDVVLLRYAPKHGVDTD